MSKKIYGMLEGLEEFKNCAGESEHDNMCDKIEYLEKKVKLMEDFLHPTELTFVEKVLKKGL